MTTEVPTPTTDEAMGMAWWNSLSDEGRAKWAAKAGTGVAADAWAAFKADSGTRASLDEYHTMVPTISLPNGLASIRAHFQSEP